MESMKSSSWALADAWTVSLDISELIAQPVLKAVSLILQHTDATVLMDRSGTLTKLSVLLLAESMKSLSWVHADAGMDLSSISVQELTV